MKIILVIPAYNEEKNIGQVLRGAQKYTDNIIVIDDGSKDKTREIALNNGAKVYSHGKNYTLINDEVLKLLSKKLNK